MDGCILKYRDWSWRRKRSSMEGDAGKDLGCQKTMAGKANDENGSAENIPSCCLKAKASTPELEAKCHSTVVSGWFTESQSLPDQYL